MFEAVKKVAITVVKSDVFKTGATMFVAGSGLIFGLDFATRVTNGMDAIKNAIGKIGKKKGLKEEDSEEVIEEVNA